MRARFLRVCWCQLVALEGVVDIADDRARLVHREIAMSQDWHPLERVQGEMTFRVHFSFEIVEGVGYLLMGQNDPGHLYVNTTWKTEQRDVRHGCLLHAAAKPG